MVQIALGASALMQGLADGYFVIPYTLGDYLATIGPKTRLTLIHPAFEQTKEGSNSTLSIQVTGA